MENNLKPITINPKSIILSQEKSGEIVLSVDAKSELEKILYVRDLIEKVYSAVQEKLTEEMNARKFKKIVAGNIVVNLSPSGYKYAIKDKSKVDKKFLKTISYQIPNSKEIDKVLEEKGKLPEFTDFNLRKYTLEIVRREDE